MPAPRSSLAISRSGGGRTALVLAGGAARGAYEVGVVDYILKEVSAALGAPVRLDILCGTSVGALNACFLAAFAGEPPAARAARLVDCWRSFRIDDLVRISSRGVLETALGLLGRAPPIAEHEQRRGGLLDPSGLQRLVEREIPFQQIGENLKSGLLHAVTVSTTHVGSGRTVVFVERAARETPPWGSDPTVIARAAALRSEHALASAALPLLFPAVRIDGEFHCDGGLRQNVPLSPARRLGATGLVVVSPSNLAPPETPGERGANEEAFPAPLFLLGKAMNALLLDRVENDIDRLRRINAILEAGSRRYGPGFTDAINEELGTPPGGVTTRPLRTVLIRASANIGQRAAEFIRGNRFLAPPKGLIGYLLHRFAEGEEHADVLSHLLLDGNFAAELIEVGRADARAHHQELCAFFSSQAESRERG